MRAHRVGGRWLQGWDLCNAVAAGMGLAQCSGTAETAQPATSRQPSLQPRAGNATGHLFAPGGSKAGWKLSISSAFFPLTWACKDHDAEEKDAIIPKGPWDQSAAPAVLPDFVAGATTEQGTVPLPWWEVSLSPGSSDLGSVLCCRGSSYLTSQAALTPGWRIF